MGSVLVKRRFAWFAVVMISLIPVAMRALMIRGWIRRVHVSGPSMTPTLWGPSVLFQCGDCGIPLRTLTNNDQIPDSIRCFNCGTISPLDNASFRRGSRVLIDRAAYWFDSPKRFDLIAIQSDDGSRQVKRVIGMPGEKVGFRKGDLLVDGFVTPRTFATTLTSAIEVHNDRFRKDQHSRWRCDSGACWKQTPYGFEAQPNCDHDSWLIYHHELVHEGNKPGPILDDYPANSTLHRQLSPAGDFILQFDATTGSRATVSVCFHGVKPRLLSTVLTSGQHQLTFGFTDGIAWLRHGEMAPSRTESQPHQGVTSSESPLAIRVEGDGSLEITNIRISRDVVYWMHNFDSSEWTSAIELNTDRFFVVGDNVPVSKDSRYDLEGVPISAIIGRVHPMNLSDN